MMLTHNRLNQLGALALLMVTFGINVTFAQLKVIRDYGGSSMGPYYEMLDPTDEGSERKMQDLAPEPLKIDEGTYLPVHSAQLTPAIFDKYTIDFPGLQSFFVVGYDELSIQWLKERREYLETMPGLVGVVVNVESKEALDALKRLTTLSMYALPGDELATKFKLTHYPALVTATGVEQ